MKFRDHYFKREATVGNSDTVVIDLNIVDPISYISVEYEATNGGTSCLDHELHDDVDKIELVDGSNVLFSLSGVECLGLNAFELGKMPHQALSEVLGEVQEETFYIHFGRKQDDLEYYLDPKQFSNPQLRLTHSLDISATAGFATGTGKITVIARVIEEGALPYKGFLSTKQKYSWLSGASGDQLIDLPHDHPYRFLLVKALLTTYTPQEVLTKLKLSVNADKYVPFEMYTEDLVNMNWKNYGLFQQVKAVFTADDGDFLCDLYDIKKAHIYSAVDEKIATIEIIDAEKVSNGLYSMAAPATPALDATARKCVVDVDGLSPCAMVCIPLGDPMNPETWLNAPEYGDIDLYCTQGAAGACSIVLQQLRI